MSEVYKYYKWWEDKDRPILVYNKSEMAECFDVSLKTVDSWCRKGAPIFSKGSNGKEYKIDIVAFVEWKRARDFGITVDELRVRDENNPVMHLLQALFLAEIEIVELRRQLGLPIEEA
jgi:phage terminase Nu1 subunit (DNA packaging protein)